jgi:hypothetical protein
MSDPVIFKICAFLFIGLVGYMLWLTGRDSGKLHDTIESFRKRGEQTNNPDELIRLNRELIALAKKECWHRAFSTHALEVNNFLVGKVHGLLCKEKPCPGNR